MERKGYPRVFATTVTISGSVQAILIPPSHNAVIYSLAAGGTVSIAQPVHGRLPARPVARPDAGDPCRDHRLPRRTIRRARSVPLREALKIAVDALWGLMTW